MTPTYVKLADSRLTKISYCERLRCGCGCMKFALLKPAEGTFLPERIVCLNCHAELAVTVNPQL